MWIVRLALRRPYTVATLSLVIFIMGFLSISRMQTDILPAIDIPVVVVIWNYPGLSAQDVERRVTFVAERGFSTTVDNVDHIESESISGVSLQKLYFAPGTDVAAAIAQITAQAMQNLRFMPPGMQPPNVLQFNASNVTVAQITMSSQSLSALQMFDYANNFLRLRLFTIPGVQMPPAFGGTPRQVSVDLDPARLAAHQLSPADVVNALLASNVILPAGIARIGNREYDVNLNSSPPSFEAFNRIPIKTVNGAIVYVGDVAHVHDGYATSTNVVHVNGRQATYIAVLKKSNASTLAVVDTTREMLPSLAKSLPGLELRLDFDQSIFVRAAIRGVLREGVLAAVLVATMILGFLGSWRSVLIVCTSIPLAILVSVVGLFLTGQSLNLMTLGGLALSIGMLVDDATVEVENIHRNRRHEPRLAVAILDSAQQVAMPALATTLTVCIVFFPVTLLTGPARFLFFPLALAVVFAMIASYVLSRTLVPSMSHLLMPGEPIEGHGGEGRRGLGARFNAWRERSFERLEGGYERALRQVLGHARFVLVCAAFVLVGVLLLTRIVGLDFFPSVDTGMLKLHFRAPPGTRIEQTDVLVAQLEARLRALIPPDELQTINDNIGIPLPINLGYVQTDNIGGEDADVLVQLKPGYRIDPYREKIRAQVFPQFPGAELYFQPADVISQVLNFGSSAPIDVQVQGRNVGAAYEIARRLASRVRGIPGTADVHVAQVLNRPALQVAVDRERAAQVGLTERDVASSLLTSLSSSSLASPNFWVNPGNNVNYQVAVQTPITRITSVPDLLATPIAAGAGASVPASSLAQSIVAPGQAPYLGVIAGVQPSQDVAVSNHYTSQPIIDVMCSAEGRDLGGVARDIQRAVAATTLPDGIEVNIRGQSEAMFRSFGLLALGLVLAIALVYLLLVTLLQSWLDPFIILVAIPGALTGVLWILVLTGTTLNVESLMGAIMVVGIAVSNSNLLVNFANEFRAEREVGALDAAVESGRTRLRPVLMTALAMILGMLPMALGLGEGGEQNAPLGRAVIGGLVVATVVTLFLVPLVYSRLRRSPPHKHLMDVRFDAELAGGPTGAHP